MERLDEVLGAPPGPSRHGQVAALARHYGAERPDVITKEVALAEPATASAELTGAFEALVSDYGPDRQNERFARGAWDAAIAKIRDAGKAIPVLFGHDLSTLSSVLGMVPSTGWRVDERGLWAQGWLDTTDPLGQKLHRMLTNGALQWSVGFALDKARRGPDGIRVLEEVRELYELSVVPVPANARTRTVSAKSHDDDREPPSLDELRDRERDLGLGRRLRRDPRPLLPPHERLAQRQRRRQHREAARRPQGQDREGRTASTASSRSRPSTAKCTGGGTRSRLPLTADRWAGQRKENRRNLTENDGAISSDERMTELEKVRILEDLARHSPSPTARISALRELRLMGTSEDDVDRLLREVFSAAE